MEVVIILSGAAIFIFLIFLYSRYQAQKRQDAWKIAARQMKFQFIETDNTELEFGNFKIFTLGRRPSSINILIGKNDEDEIRTLDYEYTTGSGKNSHTHYQTLCILRSKALNLPHFFTRKENSFFDFLGKLFGGQDINFTEDPTFSKAFVLQGENETAIRNLFNARIRRAFLQFEGTDMQIEGREDILLFNPCIPVEPMKVASLIMKAINVKKAFCPKPESFN